MCEGVLRIFKVGSLLGVSMILVKSQYEDPRCFRLCPTARIVVSNSCAAEIFFFFGRLAWIQSIRDHLFFLFPQQFCILANHRILEILLGTTLSVKGIHDFFGSDFIIDST